MSKKIKLFFSLSILLFLSIPYLTSCIKSTTTDTNTVNFYSNAANTTPVFSPLTQEAQWGSGNPLYSVYYSLRQYLKERDEGVVDRSNIYKLIADVDTVLSGISSSATSITEQEIHSPFASLPSVTCDKAINDETNKRAAAIKETSSNIEAILTWIWTDTPATKNEYGIATVNFDKVSKNLTIDMTYSVDYDLSTTATDYNMRCHVEGNTTEHNFKFKYIIGDTKIVAQGISQWPGNYMLFKYISGSDPVKYIVTPSDADEGTFIAENSVSQNIYTDPNNLPSTVSAYKDWVVSTDFFTSSDLMTNTNLLNAGNDKAGTIYIKYN